MSGTGDVGLRGLFGRTREQQGDEMARHGHGIAEKRKPAGNVHIAVRQHRKGQLRGSHRRLFLKFVDLDGVLVQIEGGDQATETAG